MTINSFLLLTIFPALLPPSQHDDDDLFEYYDCLGLNVNERDKIDITDIRKAYRKKSLQLHPDKIAQKRGHQKKQQNSSSTNLKNDNDMKKQYEHVQEAYNCLQDEKNRILYHDYGCNVIRYRFVSGPHPDIYNPTHVGENLTKASVTDKTRIVASVTIILLLLLLQPILIATKVNGERLINTSWIVVLIPWLVMHSGFILMLLTLVVITKMDIHVIFTLLESIAWFAGIILLAIQWDNNNDDNINNNTTNWNQIAIPFYIIIMLRIIASIIWIKTIKQMQSKMITMKHLEKKYCHNNDEAAAAVADNNGSDAENNINVTSLEDLSEDKQKEILKQYVIVHNVIDDDAIEIIRQAYKKSMMNNPPNVDGDNNSTNINGEDDEEEVLESIRVQTSEEYKNCDKQTRSLHTKIGNYVLFGITFIILVSKKLTFDSKLYDTSWWIIFLPILVPLVIAVLINCCIGCFCCCFAISSKTDNDDPEIIFEKDSNVNVNEENNNNNEAVDKTTTTKVPTTKDSDKPDIVENDEVEKCIVKKDDVVNDVKIISDNDNNQCSLATTSSLEEDVSNLFIPAEVDSSKVLVSKNGGSGSSLNNIDEKDDDQVAPFDEHKDEENATPRSNKSSVDETMGENDDDDDDDDEAESAAAKSNAAAISNCCWYSFQLIILCLMIGLLESSYDDVDDEGNNDNDNDGSYSAFWILFPFFLFTGVILCCCSWLLYCTKGDEFDRMKQQHEQYQQNEQQQQQSEQSNGMNQGSKNEKDDSAILLGTPPIGNDKTTATDLPGPNTVTTDTANVQTSESPDLTSSTTKPPPAIAVDVEHSNHSVPVMDDID